MYENEWPAPVHRLASVFTFSSQTGGALVQTPEYVIFGAVRGTVAFDGTGMKEVVVVVKGKLSMG